MLDVDRRTTDRYGGREHAISTLLMSARAVARSTSVIIAGGGPVGLAVANELGYRGVDFILVDEGDGAVPFPAGEALFSRTLEHLRRWGMADQVRYGTGFPDDLPFDIGFTTSLTGRLLTVFEGPSNAGMPAASSDVSPEGIAICPKFIFDPLLRAGAKRFACGTLLSNTRVNAFHDNDGAGVTCTIQDLLTGAESTIEGAYLAACDGARSMIRRQLDIPLVGSFGQGHNFAVAFTAPGLQSMIERQFGRRFFQIHTVNVPNRP
jgi:2-polyprenyl-6-methoxyphenol hydroxylase-like FAD-dependent oxidoreductase